MWYNIWHIEHISIIVIACKAKSFTIAFLVCTFARNTESFAIAFIAFLFARACNTKGFAMTCLSFFFLFAVVCNAKNFPFAVAFFVFLLLVSVFERTNRSFSHVWFFVSLGACDHHQTSFVGLTEKQLCKKCFESCYLGCVWPFQA